MWGNKRSIKVCTWPSCRKEAEYACVCADGHVEQRCEEHKDFPATTEKGGKKDEPGIILCSHLVRERRTRLKTQLRTSSDNSFVSLFRHKRSRSWAW